jgi:two-component system, response regulator PdtaR
LWGDVVQRDNIVVADNDEAYRKTISDILNKQGYKVYTAADAASTLRICRSIIPSLVIIDVNLRGMSAYDMGQIIEGDNISTALFITGNPDKSLFDRLEKMNLYSYLTKPIIPSQFLQIIEFSIANSNRLRNLKAKIIKLENTLTSRKKIEKAKEILAQKLKISESEAYKNMRKESMDSCKPMELIAEQILSKYSY